MQVRILTLNGFSDLAVLEDECCGEHPRDVEQTGKWELLQVNAVPSYLQVSKNAVHIGWILNFNRQHSKDNEKPQKQPISLHLPFSDDGKRLLIVVMKQRELLCISYQLGSHLPKRLDDCLH